MEATLELARLVHEVSRRGERGRRLAADLLSAVARYTGDEGPMAMSDRERHVRRDTHGGTR
jgi:hypothetical protein